jgi:hypothetical protein
LPAPGDNAEDIPRRAVLRGKLSVCQVDEFNQQRLRQARVLFDHDWEWKPALKGCRHCIKDFGWRLGVGRQVVADRRMPPEMRAFACALPLCCAAGA